ncbi:hypothetical protein [Clostridium tarantellae]|uniref:Uncharacterized protein n=1 Tax=Clostridium tarantellae TaxID=39493 RepID=A0A6I1MKL2_9CLOT|nr:hypothetical protein [Clostridium tarantellae]MPQ43514.1 hypothetical protein [Clostridium tarantellae]
MKNIKLTFAYIFTLLTCLLNALMIFVIRKGNENILSNYFVIAITLIAFGIYKFAFKTSQKKKAKLEFYGIFYMFFLSLMRFINRLTVIPDMINLFSVLIFIIIGTSFLFIAMKRIHSKNETINK